MSTSRGDLQRGVALEQTHVNRVYENLAASTASARTLAHSGTEIYRADRGGYLREESGTALFERDTFAYQATERLAVLDTEHEGLILGQLDLNFPEVRCIGRLSVRDAEYEPLVIDWRAPATEPFCRVTQATPMNVTRRRVLRCHDDNVIGPGDDLLDTSAGADLPILGEGALMTTLTRARDHTMRDIVATIQAEQDEAIHAPYQRVTIIGDGPDTGKTIVALHRAACLLYTDRTCLEKGGVLIVGPSSVLVNYIERVLPSLGEESVTLRTVGAVADDVLGMVSERVDVAPAVTLEGSLRMLKVLRKLIRRPPNPVTEKVRVNVKGGVLKLDAVGLAGIWKSVLSNYEMNRGRAAATTSVARALAGKLAVDMEFDPEEVDGRIRDHQQFREFMDSWWPMLDAPTVLTRLANRELLEELTPNLTAQERNSLAESYQWLQIDDVEITGWSAADVALLDELLEMLGSVPAKSREEPIFIDFGNTSELMITSDLLRREYVADPDEDPQTTYAHILVDEAQDVTPIQWRMLRRQGPQAS